MVGDPGRAHPSLPFTDFPFGKARGMVFPRVVLVGHGVIADLGTTCRQFDFADRGAVITGPRTVELAGRHAAEILRESRFEAALLIAGEATEAEVDRLERETRAAGARFVVGVGGGSKIDITKVVAARLGIPFVSLPTSAAHDGISSPRASL
ncbi:NAD(P)-dependent glycerol-1-phosphate dehydrogenase, partial [mine drainage metagenome]